MVVAFKVVFHDSALALILVGVVVDVYCHGRCLLRPRLVPDLLEEHLRPDTG